MGRRKKLLNDSVFFMKDDIPKLDYSGVISHIIENNISYSDFCDLAHISAETMQRIKGNEEICVKSLLKIINALNKLNSNKIHSLNDVASLIYLNR